MGSLEFVRMSDISFIPRFFVWIPHILGSATNCRIVAPWNDERLPVSPATHMVYLLKSAILDDLSIQPSAISEDDGSLRTKAGQYQSAVLKLHLSHTYTSTMSDFKGSIHFFDIKSSLKGQSICPEHYPFNR